MSWAVDDWTAGLTGRVLQKVRELQAQQERLGRERQQKQLQLDNAEAALHKNKMKGEEVQRELAAVQRELVGVRKEAQAEASARERLAQDLQARQAQVFSLEGQLEAAHTLTSNLTKEIKRLEAELEKLQRGNSSGDSMLFSTPCWNMASPWEHNSSKADERASRQGEGRLAHVRQQLQFSDSPRSASAAASSSSPFPQQPQKATPAARRSARNPDTSTPSALFPWERDDTKGSAPKARAASYVVPSSSSSSEVTAGSLEAQGDCGIVEELRKERDAQASRIQELQTWVQSLEQDVRTEAERYRESEARLGEAKRELAGREQSLMRSKDELGRAHTLIGQERDRVQASEQRAKQLQEELKCQRQNAETCRTNSEHKRKEMEREHQRELLELQKERQALERQHQQESHKLNQEIQQARTLHNTLQSQHDKLALQKQAVERELDSVKGTLKNTESELKETQKKEAQTQAKLTEALRDSEGLSVTIEQLKKKERSLEEEVKRLSEELAEALRRLKELQDQPPPTAAIVTPPHYSSCGDGFSPMVSYDRPSPPHTQAHRKKALRVDRAKEQADQRAKYPSDREPGEGIDSEQIEEFGSERPPGSKGDKGTRGNTERKDEAGETLSSAMEEDGTGSCDEAEYDQLCPKVQMTDALNRSSPERSRNKPPIPSSPSRSPSHGQAGGQADLKRENATLRDELRDAKHELECRLDDLEKQRRAETEARTKLKQLSRKHSAQTEQLRHKAQEQQEEKQKLEKQLEEERRESGRLKEALDAAEGRAEESRRGRDTEAADERRECERLREVLSEMERKGREMEEESGRLKEDLEALRVELSQEREEREKGRQEEEEEVEVGHDSRGKEDLLAKVVALEAELEELRKVPKENLQLKYLPLDCNCDDNKAMVDIIPSPMDHVSFCQAVNLHNTMVSQDVSTKDFITDLGACKKLAEHSKNEKDALRVGLAQDVERLKAECDSLRAERDREVGKAKLAQNRLEVLQKQVTSQTQQLTQAFESQSSHIEGLLMELQQRDAALHRQVEELRLCQEEMAQIREAKEKLETELGEEVPDSSGDAKELSAQPNDGPEDKHQPEGGCDPMEKPKAKTLDRNTEDPSAKEVTNVSTPTEPEAKEQKKELVAHSPTSIVPSQAGQANVQDGILTDVQSGSSGAQQCEIAASGNTVAFVEVSGSCNAKSLAHTETTVQESAGVEPLEAGSLHHHHQGPAAASVSEQMELSHNASVQPSTADVPASDVSGATEAATAEAMLVSQREVGQLRSQNAQLAQKLKEAATVEVQSLRMENEQLRSRLKLLKTANVHIQDCSHPAREADVTEGQGDLSVKASAAVSPEESVSSVQSGSAQLEGSALPEAPVERTSADTQPLGDQISAHSSIIPHEQQLQALLSEVRRLTEDNQRQAEELELWRIASQEPSVLLPGATAGHHGDGDSITLVREDHILLSCGTNKLGAHVLETRSRIQQQQQREEGEGDPGTGTGTGTSTTQTQHNSAPVPLPAQVGYAATAKSRESDGGDPAREVTKVSQSSSDDLQSESSATDPGGHNTKEEACDSLTTTKMLTGQADKSDHLAGPTSGVDAKANSLSSTANQAPSATEALAEDSGPDAALVPETASPGSQAALVPGAKVGVGSQSARLNGLNPTETDQHSFDGAQQQLMPTHTSGDEVGGQSSEVMGVEKVEVRKEMKSAATQTNNMAEVLDATTQTADDDRLAEEEEEDEDDVTDSPCPSPEAAAENEKRLLTSSFPIPADPVHLAERIRRNRNRMSAAYDDTEYEPYGLPEVVMKGFADIPTGPACPYVLRRGLLGTSALPLPGREEDDDVDP